MGVLASHHEDLLSELRFYQNAGGAVPSSFDCWLAQRGCKTLALRMLQHGITGLTLARWLQKQSWVKEVIYPGLEGDKRRMTRKLAWRQLSATAKEKLQELGYTEASGFPYGGMVSFRLDTSALGSGRSAAEVSSDFLSSLKLFTLAESLGGVESLAE
jgi:cystathionine gamma-lyase